MPETELRMATNTESTDVEEWSPSDTSQLVGQTLLLAAAFSVVEGSPLPLVNRTMAIGTCLLLKDLVQKTRRRLFTSSRSTDSMPTSPVGSNLSIDGEIGVEPQMLQARTLKPSSHTERARDFHVNFFSRSLSNRESEYIHDTADVATYDRPEQDEALEESGNTENSTNETDNVSTNEASPQNLQQKPYELLSNTAPPPTPSLPSPIITHHYAYQTINTPSRASSTTLVPKSPFLEGTSQMPMFDTEELVPKSTFLEGTSQIPMFDDGGRARGIIKRMASVPLYVTKMEHSRRKSQGLQVGRDRLS